LTVGVVPLDRGDLSEQRARAHENLKISVGLVEMLNSSCPSDVMTRRTR
jgi:hypothetical protein